MAPRNTPEEFNTQQNLYRTGSHRNLQEREKGSNLNHLLRSAKEYSLNLSLPKVEITSQSEGAREWTALGLGWLFSYHNEEALDCFFKGMLCAELEGTTCPLASWGAAHALGSNYMRTSKLVEKSVERAIKALHLQLFEEKATDALKDPAGFFAEIAYEQKDQFYSGGDDLTDLEAILIDGEVIRAGVEEHANPDQDPAYQYAEFMGYRFYDESSSCNQDPVFVSLFAKSIIEQSCRTLYVADESGGKIRTPRASDEADFALGTEEALDALWNIRNEASSNLGIMGMMLQLSLPMNLDPSEDKEWTKFIFSLCDEILEKKLAKGCAHIYYMCSYILSQQGLWSDSVAAGKVSVEEDEKFVAWKRKRQAGRQVYTVARFKHLHMHIYAACMTGRYEEAMSSALKIEKEVLKVVTDPKYRATWKNHNALLSMYLPLKWFVWVRFGKWNHIINGKYLEEYNHTDLVGGKLVTRPIPVAIAAVRYARTLALLYLTSHETSVFNVNRAKGEQKEFVKILNSADIKNVMIGENYGNRVLQVAGSTLEAEIAFREGRYQYAITVLKNGVLYNDGKRNGHNPLDLNTNNQGLVLDYPCPWMQPIRQSLGGLLLEHGMKTGNMESISEAIDVYEQDLSHEISFPNPNNIWSLRGLQQSIEYKHFLSRMNGQSKEECESLKLQLQESVKTYVSALTENQCDSYIGSSSNCLHFNCTSQDRTLSLSNGHNSCFSVRQGHATADFEVTGGSGLKGLDDRFNISNATPLLLIHGFMDSSKSWTKVMSSLGAERRIVSMSIRGFGDSNQFNEGPETKTNDHFSVDKLIEDIYQLLTEGHLLDRNGQVFIAGHGLGAMLAIGFSVKHNSMVKGLTLLNGSAFLPDSRMITVNSAGKSFSVKQLTQIFEKWMDPNTDLSRGFLIKRHKAFLEQFQFHSSWVRHKGKFIHILSQEDRASIMNEALKADVFAQGYTWGNAVQLDYRNDLKNIRAPSMILWGVNDTLITEEDQKTLMQGIKGTRKFRRIQGAGYGLVWTHPQEIATLINDFIRSFDDMKS